MNIAKLKKALELCSVNSGEWEGTWDENCFVCPYCEFTDCKKQLLKDSLTVINGVTNAVDTVVDEMVTHFFDDNQSRCKIANCQEPDATSCDSEVCIQKNQEYWKNKIQSIIKNN